MVQPRLVDRCDQGAVGHRLQALGHGHLDGEGGLVDRVVVGREPGRRHVRLADDHHAVVGVEDAGVAQVGVDDDLRNPVVDHLGGERLALVQGPARRDGQLAAVAGPPCRAAVDRERPDGQALEVEVEGGQVLRRPGPDGGDPVEHVGLRRVLDVQVVVPDVVPAVAVQREVRITHPGRARAATRTRARGSTRQDDAEDHRDHESSSAHHPGKLTRSDEDRNPLLWTEPETGAYTPRHGARPASCVRARAVHRGSPDCTGPGRSDASAAGPAGARRQPDGAAGAGSVGRRPRAAGRDPRRGRDRVRPAAG